MGHKILGDSYNLDTDELSRYSLLGILSSAPSFKIIHELNTAFHLSLKKEKDIYITIQKKSSNKLTPSLFSDHETETSSLYPFYYGHDISELEKIAVIKNFNGETYLLNGTFKPDFIVIVFGSKEAGNQAEKLQVELSKVIGIQSVIRIDYVKNTILNDILLDLEDHLDDICRKPSLKEIQRRILNND